MKILAIRGSDLASLAGSFSVELESGPLASAGLFAITGPTGAGKSTLLDALCVALFDKTPRLQVRGGVPIGRPGEDESMRLAANDVRSLLRRGAGSGFAEVDFVGRDGHRYRARWSVRRARNRPDGRLQVQTVELANIDTGEILGGTRSETLLAIEERLGLTFEQFCRSALLAQGDFSAFLRANGGQRAELLERMTGTEIYGAVSMAAYRRHAEETQRLEALMENLDRHTLLEDEEREALAVAHAGAAQGVSVAVARLASAHAAVAWLQRDSALNAAVQEAAGRISQAQRAWDESAEMRTTLAGVMAAQKQRAVLDIDERAAAALLMAKGEHVARAAEATERAEEAVEWAQQLERVRVEMSSARQQLCARLQTRVEAVEQRGHAARAWINGHAEAGRLADDWPRWVSAFERLAEADKRQVAIEIRRGALVEAGRRTRDALEEAGRERKQAVAALELARRESDRVGRAAADKPLEQVRRKIDEAVALREQLRVLTRAAEDAAKHAAEALAAGERKQQAEARATTALATFESLEIEVATGNARAKEAEGMLHQIKLALDLDAHRADLIDEEPCPLCGSEEHPWAEDASPINALVARQVARLDQLRQQASALSERRAELAEAARTAKLEAGAAGEQSSSETESLARATAQWRAGLAELGELPLLHDPSDSRTGVWIRRRLVRAEAIFEGLREAEVESHRADELARQAAGRVSAKQNDLDQASESYRQADRAVAKARDTLLRAEAEREAAEVAAEEARAELAAAFEAAGVEPGTVLADPTLARVEHGAAVAAWKDHSSIVIECDRELAGLRAELESARELVGDTAAPPLQDDEREPALIREHIDELRLWLDDAEKSSRDSTAASVSAAATAAAAAKELAAKRAEAERTAEQVAIAAAQMGIDVSELRARMQHDERWIEHRKHQIAAMETELVNWRAVLEERTDNLQAHRALDPPEAAGAAGAAQSVEAAEAAVVQATQIEVASREHLAELVRRLHVDDEARKQRSDLAERIAAQRDRAALYTSLSDLIGSANGKKFRVFAQSLTLDALLGFANHHLAELANRYRLARVPGYDLDLQIIDRDLGDEVRSVNSLSGGESFLVSLALALGLSSLSARDTRVESLLIDEGFGSLDPATLEIALSVLDALQASGRKVGLISHVPGLAERIGVCVQVTPRGGGRSAVQVCGA